MSHTAFVYGTLMCPEVVKCLIRRVPPMQPASLRGFHRCRVKGQVFPAIVAARKGEETEPVVQGQLLLELTDAEVDTLDGERPSKDPDEGSCNLSLSWMLQHMNQLSTRGWT